MTNIPTVTSCLLCGVGGQGTVLASRLIAEAAMQKHLDARTAETIGMAQRGGCVVSHVRIGHDIASSLIPLGQADVIIGFEPAEAVRCLPYLKQGGTVVVSCKTVQPVTATLGGKCFDANTMIACLKEHATNVIVVNTDELCMKLGSSKVMNTILLGAAVSSGVIGITMTEMENAVKIRVPEKFQTLNIQALHISNA